MLKDKKFIAFALPNGIVPKQQATNGDIDILVSICLFINKEYVGLDPDYPKYDDFYKALLKLKTFQLPALMLAGKKAVQTTVFLPDNELTDDDASDAETFARNAKDIKDDLWDIIFPALPVPAASISVSPKTPQIVSLFGAQNQHLAVFNQLGIRNAPSKIVNDSPEKPIVDANEILKQSFELGMGHMQLAFERQIKVLQVSKVGEKFVDCWKMKFNEINENIGKTGFAPDSVRKDLGNFTQELMALRANQLQDYLKSAIDIDEVINNYNMLSQEPALMRLMGLIQDIQVRIPASTIAQGKFSFTFNFSADPALDADIQTVKTNLKVVKKNNKMAFLVEETEVEISEDNKICKAVFYDKSILANTAQLNGQASRNVCAITRGDKLAIANKLKAREEKLAADGEVKNDDLADALTRGLLFTHKWLHHVVKPAELTDARITLGLGDDYLVRGHRVGLIQEKAAKSYACYSLTKRDTTIKRAGDFGSIYKSTKSEGAVSFDAPSLFMQDGELKAAMSDVVTEYSGELLSLKSAFAKAINSKKAERLVNELRYYYDSGLHKSIARFERPHKSYYQAIAFRYFPFNEPKKKSYLTISYDVPSAYNSDYAPRLRFNNGYSMVIYQEYLNGWGLPLLPDAKNKLQLSVQDLIIDGDKAGAQQLDLHYVPPLRVFEPLESKRPVDVFHREEWHDDVDKPMVERPSLLHLVTRSEHGEDGDQVVDDRHLLPAKTELETAFWYNLLSPDNMSPDDSFDFKRRANCSFMDRQGYDDYVSEVQPNGKKRSCPEDCRSYCGGTEMPAFNTDKHITPNHLCDPTIVGLNISLYYDEACTIACPVGEHDAVNIDFSGTPGLRPKSYLLRAKGAEKFNEVINHNWLDVWDICLKKGAILYGKLGNNLNDRGYDALTRGWWNDLGLKLSRERALGVAYRNVPRQLTFTHAVKQPLITPTIKQLSSAPDDHRHTEHLDRYLSQPAFQAYSLPKNIVAKRTVTVTGADVMESTRAAVSLVAHFERLDATEKIAFLKGVVPTGGLELWMRREVFADLPEQIVLPVGSASNHLPSEPVCGFKDPKNVFSLEHVVQFYDTLLFELKESRNVIDISNVDDVFRSLISQLSLEFDLRSNVFEEREYYLKNISKFKGYFDDREPDAAKDAAHLEDFVLPKLKKVMDDLDEPSPLRFKVLSLANRRPNDPVVAYAVTTIQENRQSEHDRTISTQKGNIVTIYVKRGRLSSGKDERIGIIVDADTPYNNLFKANNLISKAGRDILTDRFDNRSTYIQYGDIIIPEVNEYSAAFDYELGIYHFLPKFDIRTQLWKFEVELNITNANGRQLHNPFINFSLLHFQPFAINYNHQAAASTLADLKRDCRISGTENSAWCYLLPERKLSVYFDKPNFLVDRFGEVDLVISFDHESLHHFQIAGDAQVDANWKVRTNFILTVEGTRDDVQWQKVHSSITLKDSLEQNPPRKEPLSYHHALLDQQFIKNKNNQVKLALTFTKWANPFDEDNSVAFKNFRVRLVEVEWFIGKTWDELLLTNRGLLETDPLDNEDMRIRYVELIY